MRSGIIEAVMTGSCIIFGIVNFLFGDPGKAAFFMASACLFVIFEVLARLEGRR